jgi:hypothetical protein
MDPQLGQPPGDDGHNLATGHVGRVLFVQAIRDPINRHPSTSTFVTWPGRNGCVLCWMLWPLIETRANLFGLEDNSLS